MMKPCLPLLCLCTFLVISTAAFSADDHQADRAQLLETLALVEKAINNQDIDSLIPLLDNNAVLIYQDAQVARGTDEMRAYYQTMLGKTNAILKSYTTKAKVGAPARFYGNIAVADGSSKDTIVFINGSELMIDTRWSVTLVKQANQWKVIQLHFSGSLFDNPLLDAAKNKLWIAAIIAGIAGLLLGWFVGWRRKKSA
jgi:ketosteroid isomerase-like protein